MRLSAIACVALLLGGCGGATPTPPSGDFAGLYDLRVPPGSDLRPAGADLSAAADGGGGGADLAMLPGQDGGKACPQPCQAPNPVCDPATGQCAPCLPTNDLCPDGQVCTRAANSWACMAGCKKDGDCKGQMPACCAGRCVDLAADKAACGKCGLACAMGQECCAGACTAVADDSKNCGACGNACPLPPNSTVTCQAGQCKLGPCMAPFADCNNNAADGCEANTQTDLANCGGCGKSCDLANGAAECNNGCKLKSCYAGFEDCNRNPADGCETPTTKDPKNCGSCGNLCPTPANGTAGCAAGKCGVDSCKPGFGDCDNNPANGCEKATDGDVDNCGQCGNKCPQPPNGQATCQNGMCGGGACMAPFADCDNNPMNGCETDVSTSLAHCGACGKPCAVANGTPSCAGGKCTIAACNQGFADCNGNLADGCEINRDSDPKNCGQCGKVCANGQGCKGGACVAGATYGPQHTFAGLTTDHYITQGCCSVGCMDNPAVNADYFCKHFYGNNCVVRNGYARHTTPRADYPKMHKNGGCTNQGSDIANTTCDNGPCKIGNWSEVTQGLNNLICDCGALNCQAPTADCNGNANDGCETNLSTDAKNCGACGKACPAIANGTNSCAGGACAPKCNPGFGDCNNNQGDGCEANLNTDVKSCGQCGKACAANQSCVNGACVAGGVFGPNHTFAGLTTDHYITQGCCGVNCQQNNDVNADYFCKHFYGGNCLALPGYKAHTTPNGTYPKMHKNGGCTNQGSDIANTTCDNGPCKIGNWNEVTQGLNGLVCLCPTLNCNPPTADCNGNPNDGCETNTSSDAKNCGGCGKVCAVNLTCRNGACVAGKSYGPQHTFAGLTTDHYITQGCCGVNCQQNNAVNADYFCKHFYAANCTVRNGYASHTTPNGTYPKMHKNGGCTGNGSNIPNTTCDGGPCKIGNWNEVTQGINGLICDCP